ncbi:MAG: diheme cytochrome c-553 [Gemmatimonadetes bacterium]|nr:diheme cytochrome c-553 [Gemmatimonadota bacterium]
MTVPISIASFVAILALSASSESTTPAGTSSSTAERGEYLATIDGCHDCHTPLKMGAQGPAPDMSRMLSGHPEQMVMPPPPALPPGPWVWVGSGTNTAFAGPWGISYSPNLTPHATGLAAWSKEVFVKAIRSGRHFGTSRPILPPMPWQTMARMTDGDLEAIWAYLNTVPPIANHVPDAVPAAHQ